MNSVEIYDRAYVETLAKLASQNLDPTDPQIKKIAREIARDAVKQGSMHRSEG